MNPKDMEKKLQHGYHSTIETIDSLIKKEGKSLKNALEAAEDKLGEWESSSVNKAKHVSDEVRNEVRKDLHSIAEKLSETKASFLHRLEMDTKFMKSSAIHRLSSIIDQRSQELVELKDALFNNKLSFDDVIQGEHQDHNEWHDDHQFWLKEIEMWKKEHHVAGGKLLEIHDAIRTHAEELRNMPRLFAHIKKLKSNMKLI